MVIPASSGITVTIHMLAWMKAGKWKERLGVFVSGFCCHLHRDEHCLYHKLAMALNVPRHRHRYREGMRVVAIRDARAIEAWISTAVTYYGVMRC